MEQFLSFLSMFDGEAEGSGDALRHRKQSMKRLVLKCKI